MEIALELIKTKKFPVIDSLVTHSFQLKDYKNALKVAVDKKRHQSIKVVFQM